MEGPSLTLKAEAYIAVLVAEDPVFEGSFAFCSISAGGSIGEAYPVHQVSTYSSSLFPKDQRRHGRHRN